MITSSTENIERNISEREIVKMNRLFLFATYWNEIEWIETSLKQIDMINPYKVYICDGCYDDSKPIHSSDGTYEIIMNYIKNHQNAELILPTRWSKIRHIFDEMVSKRNKQLRSSIKRLKRIKQISQINKYRLNQASTFNRMLFGCGIEEGDWFMTYDCDQFYSDKAIEVMNSLKDYDGYDLISGKELTFFDSFDRCSYTYEKRDYNNMPHKYYKDVFFIPTRNPVRFVDGKYLIYSDIANRKLDTGSIYHYKIKSNGRMEQGYTLGDRKKPNLEDMKIEKYDGIHPQIIRQTILKG